MYILTIKKHEFEDVIAISDTIEKLQEHAVHHMNGIESWESDSYWTVSNTAFGWTAKIMSIKEIK